MKKICVVLLVLLMLAAMTGCGKTEAAQGESEAAEAG